ncbi:hypothetical protein B4Q13_23250, partial [Lacticaseibacillus rhamnosus]
SGAPVEIDLAATSHSTVSVVVPDDVLEFYVVRAAGPEDALAPLRALTGEVPLPPRWAFGTWVSSSFQPDTQESLLERARQIRRDGFPADDTLAGFGPPMRYLQTVCGAPQDPGGAYWCPDTIAVPMAFR